MTEEKRLLTEEERRIASVWLDNMDEHFSDSDAEFRQEWQKYKALQLADSTPGEIEALMELCKDDSGFAGLVFLWGFDMWYNHSPSGRFPPDMLRHGIRSGKPVMSTQRRKKHE